MTTSIKYTQASSIEFQKKLKSQIESYFHHQGKSRFGNFIMLMRAIISLSLLIITWYQLAFIAHSFIITFTLLVLFITLYQIVAYSLIHDSVHETITPYPNFDRCFYWILMNLLGPNPFLWRIRHIDEHHHTPNIPGYDKQIEGSKLVRLTPSQPWKSIYRFQYLYASFLYSLVTLHWIYFRDFKELIEYKKSHRLPRSFILFIIEFIVGKFLHISTMLIIPTIFLPYSFWTILMTYVIFQLILSWILTLIFIVSHLNMDLKLVHCEKNGIVQHSYMEHQLQTSMDYHPTNIISNYIFGGLSSHVAHHIFMNISSIHLPNITRIIKKTAQEYNLPYHSSSLLSLIVSHYQFLKKIGESPESGSQFIYYP